MRVSNLIKCRQKKWLSYLHCHVVGILLIWLSCVAVNAYAALAKLLTLDDPPSHVHEVCHASVFPSSESTPVHCDPDDALPSPQRLLYTV